MATVAQTPPQCTPEKAVREPLLLTAVAAGRLLGVGPTRFYELRREPGFPTPVGLPGQKAAARYRRSDLEAWVASLDTVPATRTGQ